MFVTHLRPKDWTYNATSRVSQRRNELALNVFLASLSVFFGAAILAYLLIRFGSGSRLPPVRIPAVLWASTAFALVGGEFLRLAYHAVRRERQRVFRRRISIAFAFGVAFCVSQTFGMGVLYESHARATHAVAARQKAERPPRPKLPPSALKRLDGPAGETTAADRPFPVRSRGDLAIGRDGLFVVLILLHALHFLGGVGALAIVTKRALAGRYDHEYHAGVKFCARYWRFLDVVWVALFATILLTK